MKYADLLWRGLALVIVLAIIGCANQTQSTKDESQPQKDGGKSLSSKNMMRIAFSHPVVMVNGIRPKQTEYAYEDKIELSYPQDSIQPITMVVIVDGEEKTLEGELEVLHYGLTLPEDEDPNVVLVTRDIPESSYRDIVRHGYGEFRVHEKIRGAEGGEGPIVLKVKLGTKKKSNSNEIEFRFAEGAIHKVNGNTSPVLSFPENSRNTLDLTLDEGGVALRGELQVYQGNEYTKWAPVWIALPEETKEHLRSRGGKAEVALSVPPGPPLFEEDYVHILDAGKDPTVPAGQAGNKVIAHLTLRRVKQ